MKKKISIITGGAGFIGSNLTEKLISAGHKVLVLDNFSTGRKTNLKKNKNLEIIKCDISHYLNIEKYFRNADYIFHLAGLADIVPSIENPDKYFKSNVVGTFNVLQAAKNKNIKVIQTSTSEVYGSPLKLPIEETHRLHAQSPYAASKIGADQMALSFYNSFNLPVSILRPFNTYGPRQSLRAVIPTIFTQVLNPKIKKIKLGNIYTTRDFNYIDDTVDGFISTINNNKIIGKTINLGNSYDISIKKVVELISKITKIKKEIDSDKKRIRPKKSEVDRLCASNELAKKILNWKPKYVGYKGFEEGLKLTLNWFKNETSTDKSENYTL